jgi:hypothetical protein
MFTPNRRATTGKLLDSARLIIPQNVTRWRIKAGNRLIPMTGMADS